MHETPAAPQTAVPGLAGSVRALLVFLPVGHLVPVPVGGAMATAADLAVGAVVLVWGAGLFAEPGAARRLAAAFTGGAGRVERTVMLGCAVLALFGGWMALSGVWGFHPGYAVAKGVATLALAAAAAAVALSGLRWEKAVDAWLWGCGAALALTFVLGVAGPDAVQQRVLYQGGGAVGLPFARVRGPWIHPNMMGDYLLVSSVLLWARWSTLSEVGRRWGAALAGALLLGLFLSASTAWVSAGIAMIMIGYGGGVRSAARRVLLRGGGVLIGGATLVALLVPLDVRLLGVHVVTNGIRPAIWKAALYPFVEAPLQGVGASPYLAETAGSLGGGGPALWDAHNVLLSVLGQFGVVGGILLGAGIGLAVVAPVRALPPGRLRTAFMVAWVAVAANAIFLASEDLRHVWLLIGITGLAALGGRRGP